MNYFKELKAFRDWLLINEVSTSSIALWYTLMSINNSTGWKKSFNAPNSLLIQLTGLSKQGILNARNQLSNQGLILFKSGKKGKASIYQMVSLVKSFDQLLDQSLASSLDLSLDPSLDKSLSIPKQRLRKEKEEEEEEEPIKLFELYIGNLSPFSRDGFHKWCEVMGEDLVCEAIKLAAVNEARSYLYVERILQEWSDAKIKTVVQAKAYTDLNKTRKENTVQFPNKQNEDHTDLFNELRREG